MALFTVSVLSTLNVPREVRDVLGRIVVAQEQGAIAALRMADALDAILVKMNELDVPPAGMVLESEVQERLDAFTAQLRARNVSTAAEVQQVQDEIFPPGARA